MYKRRTMLAFGVGFLASTAVSWLAADTLAQGWSSETAVHVCVAEDNVMHQADLTEACPPGHRSLYLKRAGAVDTPKPEQGEAPARDQITVDRKQLEDLERRISALEQGVRDGSLANRVVAPFEVVDRAGRRIFQVEEGYVNVYNTAGRVMARIVANEHGGYFLGRSATAPLAAVIGASADRVSVLVGEGSGTLDNRIDLGRDAERGTYRLKFLGQGGVDLAGIGQDKTTGAGAVVICDRTGRKKASMELLEDKGVISVLNDKVSVAMLKEGANGGGLLAIANSGGDFRMVEAGVAEGGYGVVRAGPEAFKPGMGVLGLPASYITGKPQ
jgi:hypothetical protein